ncbi:hypothetical protein, partial [Serratia fonticola]|uniref:hypothetical protein n=1 Tax=Serratia fonticola TaxID=47917 RepID=UPI001F465125
MPEDIYSAHPKCPPVAPARCASKFFLFSSNARCPLKPVSLLIFTAESASKSALFLYAPSQWLDFCLDKRG